MVEDMLSILDSVDTDILDITLDRAGLMLVGGERCLPERAVGTDDVGVGVCAGILTPGPAMASAA